MVSCRREEKETPTDRGTRWPVGASKKENKRPDRPERKERPEKAERAERSDRPEPRKQEDKRPPREPEKKYDVSEFDGVVEYKVMVFKSNSSDVKHWVADSNRHEKKLIFGGEYTFDGSDIKTTK